MPVLFYLLTAKPPVLHCSLWSWPERSGHRASAQQISAGSWAVGRWLPIAAAFRSRATLTHSGFLLLTKQLFKCGRKQSGQLWERRYLNPPLTGLIGLNSLLGHAQPFGQLGLGDAVFFAQAGNPLAQSNEKFTFFAGDAHGCRRRDL